MVYCIIRNPAPYHMTQKGIQYFHPDGRSQFVYEGLIVGGLDIMAAFWIILMSQWAIYLKKPYVRLPATIFCAAGFIIMYKAMITCYSAKNRWYKGWMGI